MSEHFHASLKLSVTADTLDELHAEITLLTQRIPDLCGEAVTLYRTHPNAPGAQITGQTLTGGGAVAGVICRHVEPTEN